MAISLAIFLMSAVLFLIVHRYFWLFFDTRIFSVLYSGLEHRTKPSHSYSDPLVSAFLCAGPVEFPSLCNFPIQKWFSFFLYWKVCSYFIITVSVFRLLHSMHFFLIQFVHLQFLSLNYIKNCYHVQFSLCYTTCHISYISPVAISFFNILNSFME